MPLLDAADWALDLTAATPASSLSCQESLKVKRVAGICWPFGGGGCPACARKSLPSRGAVYLERLQQKLIASCNMPVLSRRHAEAVVTFDNTRQKRPSASSYHPLLIELGFHETLPALLSGKRTESTSSSCHQPGSSQRQLPPNPT